LSDVAAHWGRRIRTKCAIEQAELDEHRRHLQRDSLGATDATVASGYECDLSFEFSHDFFYG
jgi:hypothetical protein